MVLTPSTRAMPSFPGVALFMKNVKQYARKRGYVVTMTGRRRYLPAINSSNTKQRAAAERQVRVCVGRAVSGSATRARVLTTMWRPAGSKHSGAGQRCRHNEACAGAPSSCSLPVSAWPGQSAAVSARATDP